MKVIDLESLPKRGNRAPKYLKSLQDGIRVLVTGKAVVLDITPSQAKAALNYLKSHGDVDAQAMVIIGRVGKAYLIEEGVSK